MRFTDSPEDAAFRAEAAAWLAAHADLNAGDAASPAYFDQRDGEGVVEEARAWQRRKADAGWGAIPWPKAHGGRDGSVLEQLIWDQEEARYRTPPNIFSIGLGMVAPTLMAHGTAAQQQRHIGPTLRGEDLWCQLFSEPEAGSDLAAVRTRAVRDGDDWVVDGHKVWTSRAHYAQWGFLLARTHPAESTSRALTCLVVPMHTEGVEIGPIRQMDGRQTFCEVTLSGARIPDDHRIGEAGHGWTVARTTLANERLFIGSKGERDAAYLLDRLVTLARETGQDSDPLVRQRLARFLVQVRALEYTRYRAVTALSLDGEAGPSGSIGKLAYGALMQEMAEAALDLVAAAGDPAKVPGEDWWWTFLRSPSLRIGGGTDEIQRTVIGERLLQLPREPSARRARDTTKTIPEDDRKDDR